MRGYEGFEEFEGFEGFEGFKLFKPPRSRGLKLFKLWLLCYSGVISPLLGSCFQPSP